MASNSEKITKKFIGAVEDEWQLFSDNMSDYVIGGPIGFGASSIVHSAVFKPPGAKTPVPCALKVLDLDRLPSHALRLLQRETQLMSLSKHPNVIRVRGTWMNGHKLYIAMRLMSSGSASDVMHYGWPGGVEEDVIKAILKQALQGLNYLHINGLIHRDVKAANLLIDDDGTVLLGDLGVATFLWDSEETATPALTPNHRHLIPSYTSVHNGPSSHVSPHPRVGKRKSFVGTPCWMAPEVIQGKKYDAKADIWSFGITALELTQGRPPRSREPPQKALLKTVQEAPPTLDRNGGPYKYSRAFQEIVEMCLVKNPAERPTTAQLLQMPFFRGAKRKTYLVHTVLKGLPPLSQRQERRRRPASMMQNTVASWDFQSSPSASPISAFHIPSTRLALGLSDADSNLEEKPKMMESVFDMDEDQVLIKTEQGQLPVRLTEDASLSPISESFTPGSSNMARPSCSRTYSAFPLMLPMPISSPDRDSILSHLPPLTAEIAESPLGRLQVPPSIPTTSSSAPSVLTSEKRSGSKLWRKFSFSRLKDDRRV